MSSTTTTVACSRGTRMSVAGGRTRRPARPSSAGTAPRAGGGASRVGEPLAPAAAAPRTAPRGGADRTGPARTRPADPARPAAATTGPATGRSSGCLRSVAQGEGGPASRWPPERFRRRDGGAAPRPRSGPCAQPSLAQWSTTRCSAPARAPRPRWRLAPPGRRPRSGGGPCARTCPRRGSSRSPGRGRSRHRCRAGSSRVGSITSTTMTRCALRGHAGRAPDASRCGSSRSDTTNRSPRRRCERASDSTPVASPGGSPYPLRGASASSRSIISRCVRPLRCGQDSTPSVVSRCTPNWSATRLVTYASAIVTGSREVTLLHQGGAEVHRRRRVDQCPRGQLAVGDLVSHVHLPGARGDVPVDPPYVVLAALVEAGFGASSLPGPRPKPGMVAAEQPVDAAPDRQLEPRQREPRRQRRATGPPGCSAGRCRALGVASGCACLALRGCDLPAAPCGRRPPPRGRARRHRRRARRR